MVGKYARKMHEMLDLADKLAVDKHLFLNDDRAIRAIEESVRALKASAAQMRSAEHRHSNERNPLTTSKPKTDTRLPSPNVWS